MQVGFNLLKTLVILLIASGSSPVLAETYLGEEGGSPYGISINFVERASGYEPFDSEMTFFREGETVKAPCSSHGEFLKKPDDSWVGSRSFYCELVSEGDDREVDAIRVYINYDWKRKAGGQQKRGTYTVRSWLTVDGDDNQLLEQTKVIFGKEHLEDAEFTEKVRFSIDNRYPGPFSFLLKLEKMFKKHVGRQLYAPEVERPVWTWGYNYHIYGNGTISVSGKFGRSGANFSLSGEISFLENPEDVESAIVSDEVLQERIDEYLDSKE